MKNKRNVPPLKIKSFKDRIIQQSHLHDQAIVAESLIESESVYSSQGNVSEFHLAIDQSPIQKASEHSSRSIIMIDSPCVNGTGEEITWDRVGKKNFQFKVHQVQCTTPELRPITHGLELRKDQELKRDSEKQLKPKIIESVDSLSNQNINRQAKKEPSMLSRRIESPPQLKYVKSISFRRESPELPKGVTQKQKPKIADIRERSAKNPQSLTDSSFNKNQSQKKISAIEQPAMDDKTKEILSIFSLFLPVNSNVKQQQTETPLKTSQKLIKEPSPRTPPNRISRRTENNTNFVTEKRVAVVDNTNSAPTTQNYRVARTEEQNVSSSKKLNGYQSELNRPQQLFKNLMMSESRYGKEQFTPAQNSEAPQSSAQKISGDSNLFTNTQQKQKYMRIISKMTNQKNLKLKDYLRLTSLSNDSRFDRYSKSLNKPSAEAYSSNNLLGLKQNENTINEMKKSFIFNKARTAIDTQKSILLIKASLKKKLEKAIESATQVFEQIGDEKQLVGSEYEDLVFMCNFHRVFDQNLFKTTRMLEMLLKQFKTKRLCGYVAKGENITEEDARQVEEALSPTKRVGKKKIIETPELNLIQKLLINMNFFQKQDLVKKSSQDKM